MRYAHGLIVRAACALGICFLVALLAGSRKENQRHGQAPLRDDAAQEKTVPAAVPLQLDD